MDQRTVQRGIITSGVVILVLLAFLLGRLTAPAKSPAPPATPAAITPESQPSPVADEIVPQPPLPKPVPPQDDHNTPHELRPPGDSSLAAQVSGVRSGLESARRALGTATTNNHGGYVEKARADVERAMADLDAAVSYANDHPELATLPPAMSQASEIAAARVREKDFSVKNNQGSMVAALKSLQATLDLLDQTHGGDIGGNRDKLIADIAAAASNVADGFDFLQSGKNRQATNPPVPSRGTDLP